MLSESPILIELLMTPGNPYHREKLFEVANTSHFQGCPPVLSKLRGRGGWSRLFEKSILQAKDYEKSQEEIERIISQKWADFLQDDLPHITETISQEKWLWEALPPGTVILSPKDQQAQIGEYVKLLIQKEDELVLGDARRAWIIFNLREWEQSPRFGTDRFYIYFEFNNQPNQVQIFCTICPGDQGERKKLLDMAQHHRFTGCKPNLTKWHCRLSVIQVLRADDYERSQEEIETLISEKWTAFLRDELPRMAKAIREEKWLWELLS